MQKLKAVIYIRVSDPSQIENNSLETQLKSCRAFAVANELEVVQVFREEGFSAKHIQTRPEMRKLLQFCTTKKNNIARIIVYKMDRWTRNVEEGLVTMTLLAKYGTAVVPATEIAEQTAIGKTMRIVLMAFGELDNSLKGERVRDNMRTMFRKGLWYSKPPIGYTRIIGSRDEKRGKPPIIDGNLGPMVKCLFEKAASGYFTKKHLADYLNSLGFKQFYGNNADGELVKKILSNTFYYGYMYATKWNEHQWGQHPKLVEEELWEKAYYNTVDKKRKFKHQDSNIYPLKGILRCATCNHPMTSSNPKGNGGYYQSYECHNKTCEHHERIRVEPAHNQFLSILASLKPSKRAIRLFSEMVFEEWDETIEQCQKEARLKEEQIERLETQVTGIALSNSKGILNDEEAKERINRIRSEIAVLRIEKSDIKIDQYDTETVKNFTETFLTNLDRLWTELDLAQRQVLQTEIFPDGVVCQNKEVRTNRLSQSFELIEALNTQNTTFVSAGGIEPPTDSLRGSCSAN